MSPSRKRFDVAIVGLGPVGAAAAILFADAGLEVAVIERDPEVFALPRAVGIDGEIVRAFHAHGRSEAMAALLQPTRPDGRAGFANARREWLFGAPMPDFGPNGWPPMSFFHQPELDAHLRWEALAHPRVSGWVGHTLERFEERGDGVGLSLHAVDGGAATSFEADYLVACDGANSGVRRALDIGWRDLGYDHDWLVVDVVVSKGHRLGHDTIQVCDPDRLATFVCTKYPYRRWEFKLNPGETREQMLQPAVIDGLIEPWTPRGDLSGDPSRGLPISRSDRRDVAPRAGPARGRRRSSNPAISGAGDERRDARRREPRLEARSGEGGHFPTRAVGRLR